MTLYESRMRELYPDKYKDKIFNEELMKWEPKKKHLLKRELKKKYPRKTNPDARAKAIERDSHKCVICGSSERLEVHHKKYRSDGGSDDMDNLVTLCAQCHIKAHGDEPIVKLMQSRLVS